MAEGTGAVGSALMSDCLESWLRNNVSKKEADKVTGSSKAMETIAQIPSTVLGSLIGSHYGLQWPWFCSTVCSGGALVLSWLTLKSLPEGRLATEAKIVFPKISEVLRQTWQNQPLRFSVVVGFLANAAFQPFNMFWAPILRQVAGGTTWWFGMIWVGVAGLTALGSYLAARMVEQRKEEIGLTLVSIGLPMVFPAFFPHSLGVILAGFLLHELGRGAMVTLLCNYNNRYINDQMRATENSTVSAIFSLGRMVGLGISGALTLFFSPLQVWRISASALIIAAILTVRKK